MTSIVPARLSWVGHQRQEELVPAAFRPTRCCKSRDLGPTLLPGPGAGTLTQAVTPRPSPQPQSWSEKEGPLGFWRDHKDLISPSYSPGRALAHVTPSEEGVNVVDLERSMDQMSAGQGQGQNSST